MRQLTLQHSISSIPSVKNYLIVLVPAKLMRSLMSCDILNFPLNLLLFNILTWFLRCWSSIGLFISKLFAVSSNWNIFAAGAISAASAAVCSRAASRSASICSSVRNAYNNAVFFVDRQNLRWLTIACKFLVCLKLKRCGWHLLLSYIKKATKVIESNFCSTEGTKVD